MWQLITHSLDVSCKVELDDGQGDHHLSHGDDELGCPEKYEEQKPPPPLHFLRVLIGPHAQPRNLCCFDLVFIYFFTERST